MTSIQNKTSNYRENDRRTDYKTYERVIKNLRISLINAQVLVA